MHMMNSFREKYCKSYVTGYSNYNLRSKIAINQQQINSQIGIKMTPPAYAKLVKIIAKYSENGYEITSKRE